MWVLAVLAKAAASIVATWLIVAKPPDVCALSRHILTSHQVLFGNLLTIDLSSKGSRVGELGGIVSDLLNSLLHAFRGGFLFPPQFPYIHQHED